MSKTYYGWVTLYSTKWGIKAVVMWENTIFYCSSRFLSHTRIQDNWWIVHTPYVTMVSAWLRLCLGPPSIAIEFVSSGYSICASFIVQYFWCSSIHPIGILKRSSRNNLVKQSRMLSSVSIFQISSLFSVMSSRIWWYCTSMCLVFAWMIGFHTRCIALYESQNRSGVDMDTRPKSWKSTASRCSQIASFADSDATM